MNYLMKRLREPTTYLGLAALATGAGQVFKVNEAPAVADAFAGGAQVVAGGGDLVTAGVMILGGLFGAFLRERGGD